MRRKIQLALVAGAVAVMAAPAAPARADMICQTHPATQVVCTAYYFAGGLVCKLTAGPCMT
jgi:hypothetical protein